MTLPPWLVLAFALSLTLAAVYELTFKRFGWRVILHLSVIFIAFLAGEALAESAGWNMTRLGDLRIAPDLVAAILAISGLWFLGV